ncbi:MAG: hypothetical protein NWP83_10805 [Spirosomaceae bacterium]|nr:hypothetical protein [Spirosomataceae bacterium]
MKKILGFLLLSSLLFTSCKREYALVQPAKVDVFEQKQRIRPVNIQSTPKILESVINEVKFAALPIEETTQTTVEATVTNQPTQEKKPLIGGGKKKKKQVKRGQNGTFLEKIFQNQQFKKTQKEPVKKKKKKPFRRYGTMIPTGFLFLGIAILLSLIPLNGLALLFGMASILFLYLGFRKLLRKKRRRELFR